MRPAIQLEPAPEPPRFSFTGVELVGPGPVWTAAVHPCQWKELEGRLVEVVSASGDRCVRRVIGAQWSRCVLVSLSRQLRLEKEQGRIPTGVFLRILSSA